jgi:diguanylate cyclase (GGDEF)-like protein
MEDSQTASRATGNGPMPGAATYAPYGQLVKMLLPSVGSIAIYDAADELVWCSDGYERPDLRELLETVRTRSSATLDGPGMIQSTAAGLPAFLSGLRGQAGQSLGSLVLELSSAQSSRYTGSMVASLLRPVLDCLECRLDLEHTVVRDRAGHIDRPETDWLLSVDEYDREDATALQNLLRHCVDHLGCISGALLVPDKDLAIAWAADQPVGDTTLLDRTQKHLLAWAQLNNRPMVVNAIANSANAAPYKILSCPLRDANGRVAGMLAVFRSIDAGDFEVQDVRILEVASRKAVGILTSQYDPLTGLINRLIFERRVQRCLDQAANRGPYALLYIDVDKLQALNDAFGFKAGDEVIQRIGDVIRRGSAVEAIVSRLGGDRFAVFLSHAPLSRAQEIAKRTLLATSQLGYVNGSDSVPVSVTIGIAACDSGGDRFAHLLAAAELACKRAKQQGPNRCAIHDDGNLLQFARRREQVASSILQAALKNSEFRLHAQSIVALRSGDVVGHELLVRMQSADGALLSPDKFLDAAERYELLPALDRWVLCTMVEELKTSSSFATEFFTVNVSAQSLANDNYARFALEQFAQAGLSASQFCFELKESMAVTHLRDAEHFIRELTSAGCKIVLDDFGYGLSSLAHLKRLPVQYLKIDGRFVRRVLDDRIAESIVSGLAKAAQTLGVNTIGEHVESGPFAERLRELGVDFAQGFHFGRPQPFGDLVRSRSAADAGGRAATVA